MSENTLMVFVEVTVPVRNDQTTVRELMRGISPPLASFSVTSTSAGPLASQLAGLDLTKPETVKPEMRKLRSPCTGRVNRADDGSLHDRAVVPSSR